MSLQESVDLSLLSDDLIVDPKLDVPVAVMRAAKQVGLNMLAHYGVYEDRERAELGPTTRTIRARWENQQREDGTVKSRYVAQDFAWLEEREDVFACCSTHSTARVVDFIGVKHGYPTAIADCLSAYYQAVQLEDVAVEAPKEYVELRAQRGETTTIVWVLRKTLPGQRAGAAAWLATVARRLEGEGMERCPSHPEFFVKRVPFLVMEVHMDDFHFVGDVRPLAKWCERIKELFDLKTSDVVLCGKYTHLKRERFKLQDLVAVRASQGYIRSYLAVLDIESCNIAYTPSLDEAVDENSELLADSGKRTVRSAIGIGLYIAVDRWDIQRDLGIVTRRMSAPTEQDWRRLVKIGRYLKGTAGFGTVLRAPAQDRPDVIEMDGYSDTDHAGCAETRRSTTCGCVFLDQAPVLGFSRRQAVQSLSSGESELYGATTTVAEMKGIRALLLFLNYQVIYRVHVDSSVCKSIIVRDGLGKIKHLDVRALWLQAERRTEGLRVLKVPGERNPADLGTKALPRARFEMLRKLVGIEDVSRFETLQQHSSK